jgi:hypothetical protein
MMTTLKFFVDFDKEEAWLNRMASEGHLIAKAGPLYRFTPIAPGSAVVRIDYRSSMSPSEFSDYVTLFSDAGWQHRSGSRTSGSQYFAAHGGNERAEIFSDAASKAQRYRRALGVSAALALPFLVVVFSLWSAGSPAFETLFSPSQWYQTPGIWQKQGWELVGALLFETPFVVLRIGGPVLLMAVCVLMLALVAYQGVLYGRSRKKSKGESLA